MWDNLTCWPTTPRGQAVVLDCPLIFQLFAPIHGKSPGLKARSCAWGQLGTRVGGVLPLREVGKLSEGLEKTGGIMAKNGIESGEELWDLISSSHRDKHVGRAH